MITEDPIEKIVAEALTSAGIAFKREYGVHHGALDFFLPQENIHIECKQFHSERTSRQLASVSDVILIQGKRAALAFAAMIRGSGHAG